MLKLEDLKAVRKFFRGNEKRSSNGTYKLIIEGMFHFDVPENCVPELACGKIELKIKIHDGFPHKRPIAIIEDPSLWLFPHTKMINGELCPPNDAWWAKKQSLKAFLEYLNELITAFASNDSEKPGDYYELPNFPVDPKNHGNYMTFEEADNQIWLQSAAKVGFFSFVIEEPKIRLQQIDVKPDQNRESSHGIFVWLPRDPIVKYKRPPTNWGELDQVLREHGFSVASVIKKMRQFDFPQKKEVCVILGFPTKIKNNATATSVHWQPFKFSNREFNLIIRKARKKLKKESVYFSAAVDDFLLSKKNEKIEYFYSYDCSKQSLYSRIGPMIEKKSYAIFGCGAIGSHLAFELTRAGTDNLCLIDSQFIEPGNLCRHVLDFSSVHKNKAKELCLKLKRINPSGEFASYELDIFSLNSEAIEMEKISSCNVWIDAGLPASTSNYLSSLAVQQKKRMISCYVTDKAKYLVVLISGYECNPTNIRIEENLMTLLKETEDEKFKNCFEALTKLEAGGAVRPSVGCYSLTFQASGAQIVSVAAIAYSIMSNFDDGQDKAGGVKIYEYDKNSFTYSLLIDKEEANDLV